MAYIVPKCYHIMDVHMKTWSGYGKTRLSAVSFSSDPIPVRVADTFTRRVDIDILRTCEPATDYVIIPHQDIEDVWSFIAIE